MKKKNSYIELLRFIMCLIIFIHHAGFVAETESQAFFPSGTLAADFFFMVTGYFACAHLKKKESTDSDGKPTMKYWMKYTFNKLKRVFPYAAFGIISIYILEFFFTSQGVSMVDRILRLQNLPFELSFTSMLGVMSLNLIDFRNAPLWYLSAILIVLPLLMFLIDKFKDFFLSYVVFFLPGIIYAWLLIQYGSPCAWQQYTGFFFSGLARGLASMMMGCAVYVAAQALGKCLEKAKVFIRILLTLAELGLLVVTVYSCHRILSGYDAIAVLYIMAILLTISMSGASYTSKLQGGFFDYLGRLSMPIYCIHWGIYQIVVYIIGKPGYWVGIGITFLCCILLSSGMMALLDVFHKKCEGKKKKS